MKKIKVDLTERPEEMFSTMGCRTANGLDYYGLENFKSNIKHALDNEIDKITDIFSGAIKDGRGNICPVTIILPTLAMEVKLKLDKLGDIEDNLTKHERYMHEFMVKLDQKIFEAKDMLIERFNYIASQSAASARFMYENNTMAGYVPEEGIISALKHGTLSLGQLGVAEALQILIGCDHTTEEGMKYAKQIEQLYKDRCAKFKQEYKLNFGVYYTPAESLCYTAFIKWKEKYGDYEGVTYYFDKDGKRVDKLFFTNSMHVPVYNHLSPFEKIDIESKLTGYSSAGCITYVELDHSVVHNTEALEKIVDYAMEKDIPYFAINVPFWLTH